MKYFIDTEFNEGFRKPMSYLPTIGKFNAPMWGVELISIGIKCEDGRNYYAVSKDFNLKDAWNKCEIHTIKHQNLKDDGFNVEIRKEYWLRDNVLSPIFVDLCSRMNRKTPQFQACCLDFTYSNLKVLIDTYGKTNKEIAIEVERFCTYNERQGKVTNSVLSSTMDITQDMKKVEFFGYYSAYDWVVVCGCLYGSMMDRPSMFPKHCTDVNQMLNSKLDTMTPEDITRKIYPEIKDNDSVNVVIAEGVTKKDGIEKHKGFPKNGGIHHALEDAKWTYDLYKFVTRL